MQKQQFIFFLVCILVVINGCSQEEEKSTTIAPKASEKQTAEPEYYSLTYIAGDNGIIEGPDDQLVGQNEEGESVKAVPDEGYRFVTWSDGREDNPRVDKNLTQPLEVIATFALEKYNLSYRAGPNGFIEGESQQTVKHGENGSQVRAVPNSGHHFVNWSDGVKANPRIDTNMMSDLIVMADFSVNRYDLTYRTEKSRGSISGDTDQTVTHGQDGTLVTALSNEKYHFVGWSDGVKDPNRIDREVAGDLTVEALFERNTYRVGGEVSGLIPGTALTLQNHARDDLVIDDNGSFFFSTAIPDGGQYDVTIRSQPTVPNQTCTLAHESGEVSGTEVTSIKIECRINTYKIGGVVAGLLENNRLIISINQNEQKEIVASGPYVFAIPLNDGSNYSVTIENEQLEPDWSCMMANSEGKVSGENVTNIDISCSPQPDLKATAGFAKIDLEWNDKDFNNASYRLCLAREDISQFDFEDCEKINDGRYVTNLKSPAVFTKLFMNEPYWLQLEVNLDGRQRKYSEVLAVTPYGGLNDTGIDWCANDNENLSAEGTLQQKSNGCHAVSETQPVQDGLLGRDALSRTRKLKKSGAGSAGFDFTKVCQSGELAGQGKCPPNPVLGDARNNWACVLDNNTGLMWEVKTDKGQRAKNNTYSWYNPDQGLNGRSPGVKNGGQCEQGTCDTFAYSKAVNGFGLCGATDWRLPSRKELSSIIHNGQRDPSIDNRFFPFTEAAPFWTGTSYSDSPDSAWLVTFFYGEINIEHKDQPLRVRLVRQAE